MIITKENAPHLRRKASVTRMMVDVLIALAPTLIFSFIVYPLNTLWFYLISVGIMLAAEFVFVGLKNMMPKDGQKHTFKEKFVYAYKGHYNQVNIITPAISAIIFVLIMPAGAPLYAVAIGAFFGIVFGGKGARGYPQSVFDPQRLPAPCDLSGDVFQSVCKHHPGGGDRRGSAVGSIPLPAEAEAASPPSSYA